jgi:hypothetical protein
MTAWEQVLRSAMEIEGAIGAAVVDAESGQCIASAGGGKEIDLSVAARVNTDVLRAKMRAMQRVGIEDRVEDLLVTLGSQYHVVRIVRGEQGRTLFLFMALEKSRATLGMARVKLGRVAGALSV